jgi:hypothetical protein
MFRLWLIGSALFVIIVSAASYTVIREEFRIANTDFDALAKELGGYNLVPTFCSKVRGISGTDYEERKGLCWYKMENIRRLFPEYKNLNDHVLEEKLYEKAGQPLQHRRPWRKLLYTAAVALGFPLAVLSLGWALNWAIVGFRQ